MTAIFDFCNILHNVQHTIHSGNKEEPFEYSDFLTQMRGRVLKDKNYMDIMGATNEENM